MTTNPPNVTEAMIEAGLIAYRAWASPRSDDTTLRGLFRRIYLAMQSASCPSCEGLNISCPDGCRDLQPTKDRETASPASEAFIDAVQSAQTKLDDLRASLNGDAFGGSRLSIFATDLEALLSAACRAPTAASPTPRDTLADPDDLVQIAEAVAFYADPENWHGVYMMGEGPMADDWNETADPQYSPKPGKRAREALVAWEAALASSASQRG
jgi:hypothetical protein